MQSFLSPATARCSTRAALKDEKGDMLDGALKTVASLA